MKKENVNLISSCIYIYISLLCRVEFPLEREPVHAPVWQLVNESWATSVSEPKTNFLRDRFANQLFKLSAGRFVSDNSSTSVRHRRENFWKGGPAFGNYRATRPFRVYSQVFPLLVVIRNEPVGRLKECTRLC